MAEVQIGADVLDRVDKLSYVLQTTRPETVRYLIDLGWATHLQKTYEETQKEMGK